MRLVFGRDHPLPAVISSEFALSEICGRMMAAVFAAQGWRNFKDILDFAIEYLHLVTA